MSVYIVSYDLKKPSKDYTGLYEKLKQSSSWWHYLDSTWLINTNESANKLFQRLKPHIDADDFILVIEVGRDRQGWLPEKAWDWITKNVG